nr:MAG TPA: hypothetical protein [Caudoviricetes sp.]
MRSARSSLVFIQLFLLFCGFLITYHHSNLLFSNYQAFLRRKF